MSVQSVGHDGMSRRQLQEAWTPEWGVEDEGDGALSHLPPVLVQSQAPAQGVGSLRAWPDPQEQPQRQGVASPLLPPMAKELRLPWEQLPTEGLSQGLSGWHKPQQFCADSCPSPFTWSQRSVTCTHSWASAPSVSAQFKHQTKRWSSHPTKVVGVETEHRRHLVAIRLLGTGFL